MNGVFKVISLWCGALLFLDGIGAEGNRWKLGLLHRTGFAFQTTSLLQYDINSESSLQLLQNKDLLNIEVANLGESMAYRYYLKIQIEEKHDSKETTRTACLTTTPPDVTFFYGAAYIDGFQMSPQIRRDGAATIHFNDEEPVVSNGTEGAYVTDCAWVVPLILDGVANAVTVELRPTSRGNHIPSAQRFQLTVDGMQDSNGDFPSLFAVPASQTELANVTLKRLSYLPGRSPIQGIVLHEDHELVALTDTQFDQITLLEVESSSGGGLSSCSCPDSGGSSILALPDRMVLTNESGVWEVRYSSAQIVAELVLDRCIGRSWLSSQPRAPQTWRAGFQGRCEHEGRLYVTSLQHNASMDLVFEEVINAQGDTPCESFGNISSCVLSQATAMSGGSLLLVLADDEQEDSYFIVQALQDETGNWVFQQLSQIPRLIPEMTTSHPRLMSDVTFSNSGSNHVYNISGMTVPSTISHWVYFWGTHLLYSPDGGAHVYQLTGPPPADPIRLMATHTSGSVAFITQTKQIWAGLVGHHQFTQIYPSTSWDVVAAQSEENAASFHGAEEILTMFFDHEDILRMIYTEDSSATELKVYSISVEYVLHHMSVTEQWAWELLHTQSPVFTLSGCPFEEITVRFPAEYLSSVAKNVLISSEAPLIYSSLPLQTPLSLTAWSALQYFLQPLRNDVDQPLVPTYQNTIIKLQSELQPLQSYHAHLFRNGWLSQDTQIPPSSVNRVYYDNLSVIATVPELIFLDIYTRVDFSIAVRLRNGYDLVLQQGEIYLEAASTNLDLVGVTVHKILQPLSATVTFQVTIEDLGTLNEKMAPGRNLLPMSVHLSLWHAPLKCFSHHTGSISHQGSYNLDVLVGCPPAQKIQFEPEASLQKLRAKQIRHFDCLNPDPNYPCFYYSHNFYPYFQVFNTAAGQWEPYEEDYILKVIGGSEDGPQNIIMYTEEQILKYNNKHASGNGLIWDALSSRTDVNEDGWLIYRRAHSGISWICQVGSPCDNVMPGFPDSPEMHFLIEFSNPTADAYCDYTMRFIIHIHGLPISIMKVSLPLVMVSIGAHGFVIAIYMWYRKGPGLRWASLKAGAVACLTRHQAKVQPEGTGSDEIRPTPSYIKTVLEPDDWRAALEERLKDLGLVQTTSLHSMLSEEEVFSEPSIAPSATPSRQQASPDPSLRRVPGEDAVPDQADPRSRAGVAAASVGTSAPPFETTLNIPNVRVRRPSIIRRSSLDVVIPGENQEEDAVQPGVPPVRPSSGPCTSSDAFPVPAPITSADPPVAVATTSPEPSAPAPLDGTAVEASPAIPEPATITVTATVHPTPAVSQGATGGARPKTFARNQQEAGPSEEQSPPNNVISIHPTGMGQGHSSPSPYQVKK